MDCILLLVNNPIEIFEETTRLLLKIADNIINDPDNPKIRTLQKSNATIKKKILSVKGGEACLKEMGFQENEEHYNLPVKDSLHKLKLLRVEISNLKNGTISEKHNAQEIKVDKSVNQETSASISNGECSTKTENNLVQTVPINMSTETFKQIKLPSYEYVFSNSFLRECENLFHRALIYEDPYLQERALSVIPLGELELKAQNSLRHLQEKIKKEKLKSPEVNLQDFLILELLAWFKNDFFEWMDNPKCVKCSGKTMFSHISDNKEEMKKFFTNKIEMHKCDSCNEFTPFPRYNDPNILLETRKGRCGEWANTFTLMCRAMGWDARFVQDQTDHVWTEVYSFSQKRWLHCDPCENVCDNPLMYESGWGKKVSYVMAFSNEEIQDVTWRYTSQHQAVLQQRNKCSEMELIEAIFKLRENRQKNFSASRKEYLSKRLLSEVIELMVEKQPTEKNKQGRTSGALDWRLTRGEVQDAIVSKFIWEFDTDDVTKNSVSIQYSSALDEYHQINSDSIKLIHSKWETGVFECDGIFRKVESDWKKSYLCRKESCDTGNITWKFQIVNADYTFDTITYNLASTIFEDGCVEAKICDNEKAISLAEDKGVTCDFNGKNEVSISVHLSGGRGDSAWQHAQLFREDCDEKEFSFILKFTFIKRS